MTYDVAIVGASIAGCSAAILYAKKGAKVLIIEKAASIDSYKKHCTHFVQPCGVGVLKKLDLYKDIDRFGLKSKARFWTSAGWVESESFAYSTGEYAINLERSRFDPFFKDLVKNHPLITLKLNANFQSVYFDKERGKYTVKFFTQNEEQSCKASLAIAADGRHSKVAKVTNNEVTVYPNDRFVYFAYYKQIELSNTNFSDFWMLGEHMAFIYPLIKGYSLVALYIHDQEKEKWKQNLELHFDKMIASLPDCPNIKNAERTTSIMGMKDIRTFSRSPLHQTIPFIGDAALSLDPAAGTGCSFALLTASWLVDLSIDVINDPPKLEKALEDYAEKHSKWMAPHVKGIAADSLVTKKIDSDFNFYSKIVESGELTEAFLDLTGRLMTPKEFQKKFFRSAFAKKT